MSLPVYNSGEMDRLITFKSPNKTRGSAGGVKNTWTTVTEQSWAKWLPQSGAEVVQAQAKYTDMTGILRIRYRSDVLATWRLLLDGGTQYELIAPPLEIGRQEFQDLVVKLVNVP